MSDFELYVHHNPHKPVWVRKDLKGKHREFCNCWKCGKFFPGEDKNCPIASKVFGLCEQEELVLPVWECPVFEEK